MRISAAGAATREQVWLRYVTPELWPTWAPHLRGVTCADSTVRAGSSGTVHGPAGLRVPFEVLEIDDVQRTWSWRVGRPIGITMKHGVDDAPEAGARAWVELPLALLGYAPLAQLALRRLVRP
ncbi:MAG: hypothetical protein ABIR39_02215 [Nocardioides sp.]|uniref:hypothetical protein n=1 Tax=Nocardioides sp. TaxID=35761 RepID=UPI003264B88C